MQQAARTILHVDMNAYFASVEQKANPLLRGKPLLVVADSRRRSVVMTASYEARAFGVKTGMNLYEAKKLCPQALVVDGDSAKYLSATSRILEVLETFSDQVEMVSCDEAFLDVTASLSYFHRDGEGVAHLLKERLSRAVGLPCSVGLAPNKLLAKLASDRKKPDGLTIIRPEEVESFLAATPVEDLSGIGRKLKARLAQIGIRTCGELGRADLGLLQNFFGFWGHWLKRMGQGKDDAPVRKIHDYEAAKSVGHSTTFPRDTDDPELLSSFLLLLSEKVAARLRKKNLGGTTISLVVRYKDFETFARQSHRKEPTQDGREIHAAALAILSRIQPLAQPVRLLGVSVSSLAPDGGQASLFEDLARRRRVNEVVDQINRRYGAFTLQPMGCLPARAFGLLEPPIPPNNSLRHLE